MGGGRGEYLREALGDCSLGKPHLQGEVPCLPTAEPRRGLYSRSSFPASGKNPSPRTLCPPVPASLPHGLTQAFLFLLS